MTAPHVSDVAARIETFVREHFRVAGHDTRFSRRAPLFDLGYVDSVGVIELLEFVNEQFGVRIPDEALLSDEFTTIDGMAVVIRRLLDDPASRSPQRR
ncbi:MAG TPA: acyl carrier protein [Gemmatimonadaceae bacterium]|nr:acyl carrier protein [Gemmatimonadaceae bacterium]